MIPSEHPLKAHSFQIFRLLLHRSPQQHLFSAGTEPISNEALIEKALLSRPQSETYLIGRIEPLAKISSTSTLYTFEFIKRGGDSSLVPIDRNKTSPIDPSEYGRAAVCFFLSGECFLFVPPPMMSVHRKTLAGHIAETISKSSLLATPGEFYLEVNPIEDYADAKKILANTNNEIREIEITLPPPNPRHHTMNTVNSLKAIQDHENSGKTTLKLASPPGKALIPTGEETIPERNEWAENIDDTGRMSGSVNGKFVDAETGRTRSFGPTTKDVELTLPTASDGKLVFETYRTEERFDASGNLVEKITLSVREYLTPNQ